MVKPPQSSGLFGDLSYNEDKPLYQGIPLKEANQTLATLDKKYWDNKTYYDNYEIMVSNLKVHDENQDLKDEAMTAFEAAKPIVTNGRWEDATKINSEITKKVSMNKGFLQALENKQNEDKALAIIQEMKAKGQNGLYFDYGQSKRAVDAKGNTNEYKPVVETQMDYDRRLQDIWKEVVSDTAESLPESDPSRQLIMSNKIEQLSPDKIAKMEDEAYRRMRSTSEGDQYIRKRQYIDKSSEPDKDLRKLVRSVGDMKVFRREDRTYTPDQFELMKLRSQLDWENDYKKSLIAKQKALEPITNTPFRSFVQGNPFSNFSELSDATEGYKATSKATTEMFSNYVKSNLSKGLSQTITPDMFDPTTFKYLGNPQDLIDKDGVNHYGELAQMAAKKAIADNNYNGLQGYKDRLQEKTGVKIDEVTEKDAKDYAESRSGFWNWLNTFAPFLTFAGNAATDQETDLGATAKAYWGVFKGALVSGGNPAAGTAAAIGDISQALAKERQTNYDSYYKNYLEDKYPGASRLNDALAEDQKGYTTVSNALRFYDPKDNVPVEDYIKGVIGTYDPANKTSSLDIPQLAQSNGENGKGEIDKDTWSRDFSVKQGKGEKDPKVNFVGVYPDPDSRTGKSMAFTRTRPDGTETPVYKIAAPADIAARIEDNAFGMNAAEQVNQLWSDVSRVKNNFGTKDFVGDPTLPKEVRPRLEVHQGFEGVKDGSQPLYTMYFNLKDTNGKTVETPKSYNDFGALLQDYLKYMNMVQNKNGYSSGK